MRINLLSILGVLSATLALQGCMEESNSPTASSSENKANNQFAARLVSPTLPIAKIPNSTYNSSTNLYPAFPLNTANFKGYIEQRALDYANKKLTETVNSLSPETKSYFKSQAISSINLDVNTGIVTVSGNIKFSKTRYWIEGNYNLYVTIKLQLVANSDYSDFGLEYLGTPSWYSTGNLDFIMDAIFKPSLVDYVCLGQIFWTKSGFQPSSSTPDYVELNADLTYMINQMLKEGGWLAGLQDPITGSYSYNGVTVSGYVRTTVYCQSFNLSTGTATFLVQPYLWLSTSTGLKSVFIGSFNLGFNFFLQPIKDHNAAIVSLATSYAQPGYQSASNNCSNLHYNMGPGAPGCPIDWASYLSAKIPQATIDYWADSHRYLYGNNMNWWIGMTDFTTISTPKDVTYLTTVLNQLRVKYASGYGLKISGLSL